MDTNRRVIAAAIVAVITVCWLLPMRGPLWIDETGTYWVVKDSLAAAIGRAYYWAPFSPYYLIEWAVVHLAGKHEILMRLPSTAAVAAATLVVYRIGRRLCDAESAALAALVFAGTAEVAFAAADARPYGVTLLCLAASVLSLLRWLATRRDADAVATVLLAALTVYGHVVLAIGLLVPALYAAWRATSRWRLALMGAATAVLLAPLLPQLRAYLAMDTTHVFADAPGPADFMAAVFPPRLAVGLGVGLLAARMSGRLSFSRWPLSRPVTLMLAAWAVSAPAVFLVLGYISGLHLLVPRYVLSSALPLALLAGILIRTIEPTPARTIVACMTTLVAATWFNLTVQGVHGDGWRDAMAALHREVERPDTPVLISSPFVEAQRPELLTDPLLKEVLFAPELFYPPSGRVVHLLQRFDEAHLRHIVQSEIAGSDVFLLVSSNKQTLSWFRNGMTPPYTVEEIGRFHDLEVDRFRRVSVSRSQ